MEQQIFQGPGWENQHRISMIEEGGMKRLLLNGHPYMNWPTQDDLSPRLAIVQIYGLGIGTQDELAKVFGINEKSVYNYIQAFSIKGAHGLIPQKSGPKGNWKLNARVRNKILFIVFVQRILEYEEIKSRLDAWGEHVSISSIREVLLENGISEAMSIPERTDTDLGGLFDVQDNGQLYFRFRENSVSGETISAEESRRIEGRMLQHQDREGRYSLDEKAVDRSFYSQTQRIYLNQLERGEYSAYAGGLLFIPLMVTAQYPVEI